MASKRIKDSSGRVHSPVRVRVQDEPEKPDDLLQTKRQNGIVFGNGSPKEPSDRKISRRDSSIFDVDTGLSVSQYALETLKQLATTKEPKKKRLFSCVNAGACMENRVTPSEQLPLKSVTKQAGQENPSSAFAYVNFGDFDALVDLLLQWPTVVRQRDQNERTLLHNAAAKGNLNIVKLLLANNAKVNESDEQGNLPIHLALIEGHVEVAELLLAYDTDGLASNKDGLQPIHIASERNQIKILELILQIDGVDVNAEGERGATPLHYCCIRDSFECLDLLLQHGANIYLRDLERTYPIHTAIANISHKCLQALFEHEEKYYSSKLRRNSITSTLNVPSGFVTNAVSSCEVTPSVSRKSSVEVITRMLGMDGGRRSSKVEERLSHLARTLRRFSQQHIAGDECLIELTDCEGETPLHAAVTSGNAEMVKICLERNARIMAEQHDGSTPVHYACIKDDLECVQLMMESKPELKPLVLKKANKNGYTPLHLAAAYNHEELLIYLVEQGSPLEMTDGNGWTPLLLAAMKGSFQACIQLLRLGAHPNAHDLSNRNLVHLLMLFRGPGIRTVLPEVNDEDLFKRLVNEKDNYGSTPLHWSTRMGNLGATSAFVLRGASALERDNERDTPLHTAAHYGRLHTCEQLLATAHGMRAMNSPDALGRLPLHVAVEKGHVELVRLFLDKGCVFRKCHLGNTPLHYAAIGGCIRTCRLLLQTNPSLLNQSNFHGMTALHYAAKENNAEVLEHLLTSKALVTTDKDGMFFVTYALQRRNYEVMKVIVTHPRWGELYQMLDNTSQCPVDGCIRDMPSLCLLVLDRSIQEVGSTNTDEHELIFDFTVLQRPSRPNEPPPKDPMRRIKLMVELQRKELLIHPLCSAYLQRKWSIYGRWIQLSTSVYYAILLAGITALVLGHSPIRHVETFDRLKPCSDLFYHTPTQMHIYSMVAAGVVVLTALDLVVKIWQLVSQRLEYFKDWNNYLEFLLSGLALSYAAMVLARHMDHYHCGLGVVVMFMAWFNFLLQMMRFGHVGIFVVMFLHVFTTVGKCIIVFSVVFIGFALSFHVLFRMPKYQDYLALPEDKREESVECFSSQGHFFTSANQSNDDRKDIAMELQPFQYLGLSLFKTLMMMLGEYEHTATVVEPLIGQSPVSVHFPAITLFFYVAFVFLVPIILMNLLIGLAVGDIEHVRRSAVQRLISQQVYWLADLEPKVMAIFRSRVYQPVWRCKTKREKMHVTFPDRSVEQDTSNDIALMNFIKDAQKSITKIDQHLNVQSTRTSAIVEKMEIKIKEYTLDEGVYPGHLLGSSGTSSDFTTQQ
ncbi:Tryptophan synthase alpha chain [Fasciola hepatica]|uniref:Tryptophan synthase alpha chain n=1 Tax=Fasciola hepatica TaxID=6192 RepID=A0A4E0RI42_FASHE|nr:Tryptophan synthase alpha chain [Fasciola hepatica]